jgi:DNA-binding transcriptional MerR regulator
MEKLYYSIGEVARMFDVNTSLIRFWEKEFPILQPVKNERGKRQFTQKDIENLKIVYHLVKERGYTLQGAKEFIRNKKEGADKEMEIVNTLKDIRSFLINLRKEL